MQNLDGVPITSRSYTHPSHSQVSRLLTSSLSLGVPVPCTTECIRDMQIPQIQFFRLSSHRNPYIVFVCIFRWVSHRFSGWYVGPGFSLLYFRLLFQDNFSDLMSVRTEKDRSKQVVLCFWYSVPLRTHPPTYDHRSVPSHIHLTPYVKGIGPVVLHTL